MNAFIIKIERSLVVLISLLLFLLYSCNEGEKHSFIDDSRFVQVDSEIVVNQRLFSELTAKNGLNSKSYNGEVLDGEIWNVVVNSFFYSSNWRYDCNSRLF